jgi:murein DD-endopeptidase MepM/ murein hydrolase activator NlpD
VTVGDETSEAEAPTGESFSFEGDSLVGATARVAGGGGSVNLRAEPTANAELVTTLTDGAVVNLRIDVMDTVVADDIRWWPITIDGHEGWVAGQFLTADDGSTTAPATDAATESSGSVFAAGDYVSTFTGDGDGVNLRAEASPDGALLETLSEGTVIQVMEGPVSFTNSEAGWFKVTNGTVTGFVDGDLLQAASQPSSSTDTATSTAFVAGDFALVQTQTQAGARIRSGSSPESERIGFVPETDVVEILSGPASFESSDRGWFEVSYNGTTGYIDGDLLVKTEAPAPDPAPVTPVADPAPSTSTTTPTGPFGSGETVVTNSQTGVGVNVRVAPGTASERVGYLADQSSLQVVEGPSQDTELADWYKVSDGSIEGWVAGEFLERPGSQADGVPEETARFIAPLEDYILTQHFGCSNLGYYSYNADFGCNVHDGTDLATTAGSDVLASADGTVVFSGWCDCGLGYYVEIDHGDGFHTVYGHMRSQPPVEVGQQVSQGDVIGPVGSTGLSTGPHVHFMIRLNGIAVDPRDYVNFND